MSPRTTRPKREGFVAALGLTALSLLVVILHLAAYRQVAPVDEFQHIDSAWKVSHGLLPRRGERVGGVAMEIEACRGLDADYPLPACGPKGPSDRPQFQEDGFNTAYIHAPVYYAVAGISGRALNKIGVTDFLDGARLTGALWLALGLVGGWVLLGMFGLSGWWRFAAAALPVLLPGVVYTSSIVNPDATALAAGAWLAVAAVAVARGRWPAWTAVVAAAAAVVLKSTNLVAVGAVAMVLLATAIRDPSRRRALVATATGCVAAVGAVTFAWLTVLGPGKRGVIPMEERFKVGELTGWMISHNLTVAVPPTKGIYDAILGAGAWTLAVGAVLGWLVGAGPLLGVVKGGDDDLRTLAGSALLAAFAVGPVFVVVQYLLSSTYVDIPGRYGLSLLPALVAVTLAVASPHRWRLWTSLVVAGTALVLVQLVASI